MNQKDGAVIKNYLKIEKIFLHLRNKWQTIAVKLEICVSFRRSKKSNQEI